MIEFDYNQYYPKSYFINGSLYGMNSWNKRTLDNPGDPGATIPEHIATINDTIYDSWCEHAKSIVYRNLSHLVLEF